jgi:hypothetical protein
MSRLEHECKCCRFFFLFIEENFFKKNGKAEPRPSRSVYPLSLFFWLYLATAGIILGSPMTFSNAACLDEDISPSKGRIRLSVAGRTRRRPH